MTSEEQKKILTDRLFTLIGALDKIYEQATPLIAEREAVEKELIQIMIDSGEASFDDLNGRGRVSLKIPEFGTMANKVEFFLHLIDIGDNAIAKVQLGPEALTSEILEKIRHAGQDDIDVKIHPQTFQAYLRNKNVDVLDESTWPPGIKMDVGKPSLKVKLSK